MMAKTIYYNFAQFFYHIYIKFLLIDRKHLCEHIGADNAKLGVFFPGSPCKGSSDLLNHDPVAVH